MTGQNPPETRPEQQFFEDPAIDRLTGTVMSLATETFVLRSRLRVLEQSLKDADLLKESDPRSSEDNEALTAEARAYAEHLLRPLLGIQDAVGPTD